MEKITHTGKLIEVFEREVEEGGRTKIFEYARRSPGVRIIIPRGEMILLTREYRHEVGGYDFRLPGGKVYDSLREYNLALVQGVEIQEVAKMAAIKEAKEEVGMDITALSFFHRSICGATIIWDLYYFIAESYEPGERHVEHGEDITFEFYDREEVKKMCLDGSISEERSALVLLKYLNTDF